MGIELTFVSDALLAKANQAVRAVYHPASSSCEPAIDFKNLIALTVRPGPTEPADAPRV